MSYSIGFQIQKPLQQDTIPAENGRDTKPNPAENTYEKYSECADWCNKNNAYIEDKGDYFEVVAVPEKTLDEAKKNKHSELKSTMQAKRQSLKVDYDDDQFDANETAQANMNTLLQAFNLGATSVSIRSVNEVTHTFNQAHCNELALLMADAVNKLYAEYWKYKDTLAKCETVDAVNEINWE